MDKLEEIKQVARELLAIKNKSYKLFGCIATQVSEQWGIQVSDKKFYPIMKELGIQPVYVERFNDEHFKAEYQIEELKFFFLAGEEQVKEWGLI